VNVRKHLLGILVVLAFLFVPMAIRSVSGSDTASVGVISYFGAIVIAVPSVLVLGFALGTRRELSPLRTIALAYGLAAAAGAGLGVLWQATIGLDAWTGYASTAGNGAYAGMAMVGIWGMFMVTPRAIQRERERAAIQREAERARVRAALEPHFVLNTLNAIGGLIGDDPATARELVGDLGDLLRDVVELAEHERQPASAEIAWLQRYARILETRHAGRLAFEWVVDPAAAAHPVPVLLLQPLVENAIQHGALRRPGGGKVKVELRVISGALACIIEDDGPGRSPEQRDGARGLALPRRRLACDAPGSRLEIASAPTGTRATVHLVAA
jgi:sensor histidine kinase YesM